MYGLFLQISFILVNNLKIFVSSGYRLTEINTEKSLSFFIGTWLW